MLKNNSFISKEYRSILFNILFFYLISVSGEFIDCILAGRIFGEIGMSAVEIDTPVYSMYAGIALLFSIGFQIMHAREMGAFNREKASQLLGQALVVGIIAGLVIMLLTIVLRDWYLTISGCRGSLMEMSVQYYRFYPFIGLIYPFFYIFSGFVKNDGDGIVLVISSALYFLVNLVLSIALSRTMGIAGLSLGTFLAVLCQTLFLLLHLKRKSSSLCKFHFHISWREQLEMFSYGLYACIGYFCVAIVDTLLHWFIISEFDSGCLAAYSMVNLFLDYAIIFESFSDAGNAITGVYMGEENRTGVLVSLKVIFRAFLAMGTVYMLVFICGSSLIPHIYGISTTEILDAAKDTCIIMGLSGLFIGALYFPMNMFSCIGHPGYGVLFSICFNGIIPVVLGVPLGYYFGYNGMVWGISVTPVVTLLLCYAIIRLKNGKVGFPCYLGEEKYKSHLYCIDTGEKDINSVLDIAESDLLDNGIETNQALYIHLLLEEITTRVLQRNPSKDVCIEFSFLIDDEKIIVIERDDGILFDINDYSEPVLSLNAYCFQLLMERENKMKHLTTTGNNRNGITIKKVMAN